MTKNIPARILAVLLLVALIVMWFNAALISNDVVLALSLQAAMICGAAAGLSMGIKKVPSWMLVFTMLLGFFSLAAGIFFVISEPEGILPPALIPLGLGSILAGLAVLIDRHLAMRE